MWRQQAASARSKLTSSISTASTLRMVRYLHPFTTRGAMLLVIRMERLQIKDPALIGDVWC